MKTQVIKSNVYCYVKESYFTGNFEDKQFFKCKIVSVSCYINEQITFDLLVQDSYLYHNVSISNLHTKKEEHSNLYKQISLKYLYGNYICNLQNDCEVIIYPFGEQNVVYTFKDVEHYGNYIFSVDMVNDNNIFHLIKLDSGFIFVPSHKISFSNNILPENWIKNRNFNSK